MEGMPTVAEKLRAAREAQNLTIHDVAEKTKIRTDHLRAIEEGNYNVFSAPIYIRGTIKNYASMLKLDPGQILAELDAELNRASKPIDPPPLTEPPGKTSVDRLTLLLAKLNWKVGLVVVVAVVLFSAFSLVSWVVRRHKAHDPLANLPPAVYQASNSGDMLPLPLHR
jgi:cytoskeletal protein RodZ